MSFGSVTSLASYASHIQDLFGNSGRSARIEVSYKGSSVSVNDGNGVAAASSGGSDVISLSIEAIKKLAGKSKQLTEAAASSPLSSVTTGVAATGSSGENPLSDPKSVFYNFVNSVGGPEKWSAGLFNSKADQDSFMKAFQDGSITVQSALDVKGLQYDETTYLTGTSESSSLSMNHAWYDAQNTASQGGGLIEIPMIGGLYYNFSKSQ